MSPEGELGNGLMGSGLAMALAKKKLLLLPVVNMPLLVLMVAAFDEMDTAVVGVVEDTLELVGGLGGEEKDDAHALRIR